MKKYPTLIDAYPGARFRLNFKDSIGTLDYILAQVDKDILALISLTDGNRWNKPIKIKNNTGLTEIEIRAIFNCDEDSFWTKIEEIE